MYVFFGAATFAVRSITQHYADDFFLCEVLGPIFAIILDILMAYAFSTFLQLRSAKKKT